MEKKTVWWVIAGTATGIAVYVVRRKIITYRADKKRERYRREIIRRARSGGHGEFVI